MTMCGSTRVQSSGDARFSVGILLNDHLQEYDTLRKAKAGILDRLRLAIITKAFPQEVRGHVVAADTLVDGILTHGSVDDCELFAFPWAKASGIHKISTCRRRQSERMRINITNLTETVKNGLDRHQLSAWFNPLPSRSTPGGIEVSQRLRRSYSSRMYPITTLLHGLSAHWMLYDCFLRIMLEGTYPCDSLICTSRASRRAAQVMIGHVETTFNKEFQACLTYKGRIDLIPLGVDTDVFLPQEKSKVRALLKLPQSAFIILFLGRLSSFKADLHPFLQVLRFLVKQNPDQELLWVIAGTEEKGYAQSLRDHARELGMDKHLKVVLNPSDTTKAQLLPASDVFISPTDTFQESFGLTPLEAMACGIPQVVPDWDGYRDTVKHGETGFLVPTYFSPYHDDLTDTGSILGWKFDHLCLAQSVAIDIKKTQEYLQCLVCNASLRENMAKQSRQRAVSLYSLETIVRQYEELWRELASIAAPLPACVSEFDRTPYSAFFGHYASRLLLDDTPLRITSLGREALGGHEPLVRAFRQPSYAELLDAGVLEDILTEIMKCVESNDLVLTKAVPMFDIVKSLSRNKSYHHDWLRRQIMWLVKSGYVEALVPTAAQRRAGQGVQ